MSFGKHTISAIKVQITSYTSDDNPGFVECRFHDAWNKEHVIHDKVPVVTLENLDANSAYPRPGVIGCTVIKEWMDENGREIISVTTEKPWAIDSTEGNYEFDILASQITEI